MGKGKPRRRRLVHLSDFTITIRWSEDPEDHERAYKELAREFMEWLARKREADAREQDRAQPDEPS